ncbi:hypothetical protein D3C73_1322490 [compost metagenome]
MMRPSSSGKAMCIARSRGPSPCSLARQPGSLSWAQIAWITGILRRNGRRCGASGLDWAKPVVFRITETPASSSQSSTAPRQPGSFKLASAIGNGFNPAASKRWQKTSMKAVFAACKCER